VTPTLRQLALSLLLAPVTIPRAQEVSTVRLSRPDAELPDPLSSVSGLRELSDGTLLVTDGRERRVLLVDFRTGATLVGREGAGPGEFAIPRRLFALGGDTTALHDPGNGRYLLILPGGVAAGTFTLSDSLVRGVTAIRGVDAMGRFYLQIRAAADFAAGAASEWLARLHRRTGVLDTLATLQVPAGREEGSMSLGNGMLRRLTNRPLAAEDVVAVGADGRVAVVRVSDYHVEWIDPTGRKLSGPPVRFEPIRVTPAERRAFMDAQVVPGQIITRGNPDAGARALPRPPGRAGSARGSERPLPPGFDEASMLWPANKPPFPPNAASIAPDGRLWVLRENAHTDSTARYDVFDAQGRLAMRVELPRRTRLAGLGRGVVYLTRIDDDDLHFLQRYRL